MGLYTDAKITLNMSMMANRKRGKKKCLHIFLYEKFVDRFVTEMEQNFPDKINDYWILGIPVHQGFEIQSLKKNNVLHIIDIEFIKKPVFKHLINKYDQVVFHGLFMRELIDFLSSSEILPKSYIFLWGGDYELAIEEKDENFYKVMREAKGIINITASENDIIKEKFGREHNLFSNPGNYMERETVSLCEKKFTDKTISIQVGNSSTTSNNHKEILNILTKYKNDDIKIYLPLSYGVKSYAKEVAEYGTQLFGDKCVPMLGFMSRDEYAGFLDRIDIAIFGMKRQQALGNIQILTENGTKQFFYESSVDARILEEEFGCRISHIEDIENMSFDEFKSYDKDVAIANRDNMIKVSSTDSFVANWKQIFDNTGD